MNSTTRFRSASLAARLLTLVVVPLFALTVLAIQRIDTEESAARRAGEVVELVQLQQAVAAVYPYANLERIALEGLARIDDLGLPRMLVVTIAGVDLEEIITTNGERLDETLGDLSDRFGTLVLPDGNSLGEHVDAFRSDLEVQRALLVDRGATRAEVAAAFERLSSLLADTLAVATIPDGLPAAFSQSSMSMWALSDVLVSAGDYGQTVLRAVLAPEPDSVADAGRAYAVHSAFVDVFAATLDDGDAERLAEVRSGVSDYLADIPDNGAEAGSGATDPAFVKAATAAFLDLFDYLRELQSYSASFHDRVSESTAALALDAQQRADDTKLLLAVITAVTIALIAAVLVSILRPLRRLTVRAETILNGELDLAPLAERGPSDIRALTFTMNDMLATLHRVNNEITRLATGDVDATTVPDLPGAIGVSLRDSVRHLARVTSQLQRSEQLSSAIVTQAADAIWTVGADGRILTANEASGTLTRVPPGRQIGMPISDLLSATSGEAVVHAPAGPPPTVLVANSVVDVGAERITAVIAHDISERTRFEERLEYQANHDALTGLPNRFAVMARLQELLAAGERIAVLFVDLDSFKSVNDTHGHAVGDRVLGRVAETLGRCVRSSELIGRLGGDEFVVLMRHIGQPTDAVALGYRIIREVEQPQHHDGTQFVLSASVGVAFPDAGTSALDAIRQADNAVYQAKRRGRGRVERFDASMQEQIEHEAALELALRQAIRGGELVIHLQPVFDLPDARIIGAEALVRWERPGDGLVPPGDFIPVAERSSLIFEVERWVLTQACERVAAWRRRDPSCTHRIAVNISGRHLIEGDLLSSVEAALLVTGADPTMLELELTETQLLEDLERATAVLDALRARGITIAVDDFGTGYSSMTYLRHLPIDTVKIDRSFVARATEHGYDSTVIEALLTIATTLGLTVVAEGVETEGQLEYVRERGCHRAQGFLLARPMPVEQAEALMCHEAHSDEAPSADASPLSETVA